MTTWASPSTAAADAVAVSGAETGAEEGVSIYHNTLVVVTCHGHFVTFANLFPPLTYIRGRGIYSGQPENSSPPPLKFIPDFTGDNFKNYVSIFLYKIFALKGLTRSDRTTEK